MLGKELIIGIQCASEKRGHVTMENCKDFGEFSGPNLRERSGSWVEILKQADMRPDRAPMNLSEEIKTFGTRLVEKYKTSKAIS